MAKNKGVVNLESEKPGNLVNVTKVNLISLVLNAEKIKEIDRPQSFGILFGFFILLFAFFYDNVTAIRCRPVMLNLKMSY